MRHSRGPTARVKSIFVASLSDTNTAYLHGGLLPRHTSASLRMQPDRARWRNRLDPFIERYVACRPVLRVALALFGIALGVLGYSVFPVYYQPFGGCWDYGWLTLVPGCTHWHKFISGALFVLPIAVFSLGRWRLSIAALLLLLAFAFVGGGPENISRGDHLDIHSLSDAYHTFLGAYPRFLGGAAALLAWAALVTARRRTYSHPEHF